MNGKEFRKSLDTDGLWNCPCRKRILSQHRYDRFIAKIVWSAPRPEPRTHLVTCYNDDECPRNLWVTLKSTQSALFPSIAFADTHAKTPTLKLRRGPGTLLQALHLCQASWQISEARTYRKYALAHMWQQHNVHRPSAWFRAEPKKHSWSEHSWCLLTESRNAINAQGYQPFTLSLSIYSCSTLRPFEWNPSLLSWLTSFTGPFREGPAVVFFTILLRRHVGLPN